jgi:hypothetical protein
MRPVVATLHGVFLRASCSKPAPQAAIRMLPLPVADFSGNPRER